MRDHHDRVTQSDAEQGHETHHRSQRQQPSGRENRQHAANQGERHVDENKDEVAPVAGHD